MKTHNWVGPFDLNWTSEVAGQLDRGEIALRRGQVVTSGQSVEGLWVGISKRGVKHVVWCKGDKEDTLERFEQAAARFDARGGRPNSFYVK